MIALLWFLLYSNNQLLKYIPIIDYTLVFKKHVQEVVYIFYFRILVLKFNVLWGGLTHVKMVVENSTSTYDKQLVSSLYRINNQQICRILICNSGPLTTEAN